MTQTEYIEEVRKIAEYLGCNVGELVSEMTKLRNRDVAEVTKTNIGQLRQWLNEDRITDPKKMVTNEQIEHWLLGESQQKDNI